MDANLETRLSVQNLPFRIQPVLEFTALAIASFLIERISASGDLVADAIWFG